jgi:predicted transcriptional regulator
MSVFTSSLPDDLLKRVAEKSKELSIPKNKIIEQALRIYMDQLERADYIRSYQDASNDADTLRIAEEGMIDYLNSVESGERS